LQAAASATVAPVSCPCWSTPRQWCSACYRLWSAAGGLALGRGTQDATTWHINSAGRGRVESDLSMKPRRTSPCASLQDLRQVSTYQIAPFVQAECIAPRAIPVKLFLPFHHVCLAAVFLEPADAIAAFAGALGAFDAEHVKLALDVSKGDIRPPTP
jgi:hypothetical protein